ncbi:putative prophage protein [Mycolicibacterium fortuitum]|uniref:Putative prophage protein n=1 Tax=Mycolicibacterium fortuitum TaxID=1766 RepID=A0A378V310_MYCFO|nr:putative prophage protein [Mycolicibacterium fortuitum]
MTAKLLDQVNAMVNKYVAFPSEHHSVVVALWVLHTWTVNAFYVTPRLILDSAEPGSGKTRVLELLALLCRSAKLTLSTTTAALYRRIAAAQDEGLQPPTVLQDEADAIFGKTSTPQAEDLRALFNAGYRKGATVDRCEGDAKNMKVREFPVHAPVALAGLAGRMPDTIRTRGVTLHMRRRRPDQKVADFRERDALAEAAPIREQLEAWAGEQEDLLAAARPKMPAGVTDRAAEIWEPLLAIADLAGDDWSKRARAACTYFVVSSASDDEKLSLGQRLLRDIKRVFDDEATNAMWSSDIIAKLTADAESEWRDLWGKTLDQRRLAKELNKYGVKSKTVRVGVATSRGYDIDGPTGLRQAWDHWLTPSVSDTSETSDTSQVEAFHSVSHAKSNDTSDTQATQQFSLVEQQLSENVSAVSDVSLTSGTKDPGRPTICPDCGRAPARTDTGYCDFCTARRRRQQTNSERPKVSCRMWFEEYVSTALNAGTERLDPLAVITAGEAHGYKEQNIRVAASAHADVTAVRDAGTTWWSLNGEHPPGASQVLTDYLNHLSASATEIDQDDYYAYAEANGIERTLARKTAVKSELIKSVPAHGASQSERRWLINPAASNDEETA